MYDDKAVMLLEELYAVQAAHAAGEITDEEADLLTLTIQAKGFAWRKGLHHIRRTAGDGWSEARMLDSR
jgi:hypothetical protein